MHSEVPLGHRLLPLKKAWHTPPAPKQGPLEPAAQPVQLPLPVMAVGVAAVA